jgi:hypothetical protein
MYPHPSDYLLKKTAFAVSMNLTSHPIPLYKQEKYSSRVGILYTDILA